MHQPTQGGGLLGTTSILDPAVDIVGQLASATTNNHSATTRHVAAIALNNNSSNNNNSSSNRMNRNPSGGATQTITETASRTLRSGTSYDFGRVLGNGSFGVVCEARCLETGEQVAIKKVLQDPRYKNRELDVMKELNHPNVVALKDYFYTDVPVSGGETRETQRFLNVVMDYVPDTVYRVMKTFTRNNQPLPTLLVRLYTYQMCRSLGYLHSLGICHRDIKPQNLLVDSRYHVLKLCDFGSAKRLLPGEHSVSYICSRFYRAPELMLGATEYTTAIDIWSIGCVLGELLLGKPLFAGDTSVDQLVKIIQVLGTPTRRQMQAMNPNYTEFRFPDVRPKEWRSVFSPLPGGSAHITDDALDLLNQLLKYEPGDRLTAYESLAHPFFDALRQLGCRLPEGSVLPPIFDFSEDELRYMSPRTRAKVIPEWLRNNKPSITDAPCDPQKPPSSTLRQISSLGAGGDNSGIRDCFPAAVAAPLNTTLFQQLQAQPSQVPQQRNQQFWR